MCAHGKFEALRTEEEPGWCSGEPDGRGHDERRADRAAPGQEGVEGVARARLETEQQALEALFAEKRRAERTKEERRNYEET